MTKTAMTMTKTRMTNTTTNITDDYDTTTSTSGMRINSTTNTTITDATTNTNATNTTTTNTTNTISNNSNDKNNHDKSQPNNNAVIIKEETTKSRNHLKRSFSQSLSFSKDHGSNYRNDYDNDNDYHDDDDGANVIINTTTARTRHKMKEEEEDDKGQQLLQSQSTQRTTTTTTTTRESKPTTLTNEEAFRMATTTATTVRSETAATTTIESAIATSTAATTTATEDDEQDKDKAESSFGTTVEGGDILNRIRQIQTFSIDYDDYDEDNDIHNNGNHNYNDAYSDNDDIDQSIIAIMMMMNGSPIVTKERQQQNNNNNNSKYPHYTPVQEEEERNSWHVGIKQSSSSLLPSLPSPSLSSSYDDDDISTSNNKKTMTTTPLLARSNNKGLLCTDSDDYNDDYEQLQYRPGEVGGERIKTNGQNSDTFGIMSHEKKTSSSLGNKISLGQEKEGYKEATRVRRKQVLQISPMDSSSFTRKQPVSSATTATSTATLEKPQLSLQGETKNGTKIKFRVMGDTHKRNNDNDSNNKSQYQIHRQRHRHTEGRTLTTSFPTGVLITPNDEENHGQQKQSVLEFAPSSCDFGHLYMDGADSKPQSSSSSSSFGRISTQKKQPNQDTVSLKPKLSLLFPSETNQDEDEDEDVSNHSNSKFPSGQDVAAGKSMEKMGVVPRNNDTHASYNVPVNAPRLYGLPLPVSMKPIIRILLYLEEHCNDLELVRDAFSIVQDCYDKFSSSSASSSSASSASASNGIQINGMVFESLLEHLGHRIDLATVFRAASNFEPRNASKLDAYFVVKREAYENNNNPSKKFKKDHCMESSLSAAAAAVPPPPRMKTFKSNNDNINHYHNHNDGNAETKHKPTKHTNAGDVAFCPTLLELAVAYGYHAAATTTTTKQVSYNDDKDNHHQSSGNNLIDVFSQGAREVKAMTTKQEQIAFWNFVLHHNSKKTNAKSNNTKKN